jgi:two-component system, NtrC family, response regulator GlrR
VNRLGELKLVGRAQAFLRALALVERYSACDATVLIEGETGTGKELAARAIHYLGGRRDRPFVPVNCGSLPDPLAENELFGHERGAYTDARDARSGLVSQAHGGTLFLDEVEALSPRVQVALLRFLQDGQYRPVGGRLVSSEDVRIVASTNTSLHELVAKGLFRPDLLYRLTVLVVQMPPLRSRPGDVRILAEAFLRRFSLELQKPPKRLHPDALARLELYAWPGNVRELQNLLLRAFLTTDRDEILMQDLGDKVSPSELVACVAREQARLVSGFRAAKTQAIDAFEKLYLDELLSTTAGNITRAASLSRQHRTALSKLLKKHGINPERFRDSPEN